MIVELRDWRPEIEKLLQEAKKLRAGAGQPAIYSPAFTLVKASLEFALTGVTEPEAAEKLDKELKKVSRAVRKVEDTIYRM
jgi:tRNA A58 N-methylase Trm61